MTTVLKEKCLSINLISQLLKEIGLTEKISQAGAKSNRRFRVS